MNKKLFEAIYREGVEMTSVTSEDELRSLLDDGVRVVARGVGPFGEGEAQVLAFGDINDPKVKRYVRVSSDELEECECLDKAEYCDCFAGTDVIVLSSNIGQGGNNFYMLDARTVEDCDLWA